MAWTRKLPLKGAKPISEPERQDMVIGKGQWEATVKRKESPDSITLTVKGITVPRTIVLLKGDTLHLVLPPVVAQIGNQSFTVDVESIDVTYE
jgi:hypothetical protein